MSPSLHGVAGINKPRALTAEENTALQLYTAHIIIRLLVNECTILYALSLF